MKKLIIIIACLAFIGCATKQPATVQEEYKQKAEQEKLEESAHDAFDAGLIIFDLFQILH